MSYEIIEHGSRHVIDCPQCGGAARFHKSPATYLEAVAELFTFGLATAGFWMCTLCGCRFRPTDCVEALDEP